MANEKTPAEKPHNINYKGQRLMLIAISVGIVICALIFSIMGVNMSKNSNKAIDQVGESYMTSMGYQITQRFSSVMEQRMTMVQAIVDNDSIDDPEDLKNEAQLRGFEFLAFYSVENIDDLNNGSTIDLIYGRELEVTDKLPFRTSIVNNERKIAVGNGTTESGDRDESVVMISIPTDRFTMSHGGKSMALVAGVTNEDFVKMLNINEDSEAIYSYIIRKNGSFVLRNNLQEDENYTFADLLRKGLENTGVDSSSIIVELDEKMQKNEVYSNIMHVNGHHVHIYCNKLNMSEWYMVTMMDNNNLDTVIETLGSQWTTMIIIAIVTVITVLAVIFVMYMYFNRQYVDQLKKARSEAIEASRAKSEFLSNMSHDIRTPMNAIVGMTAIARANIDNKQQVTDCLKKINLSSKHLLGLINDVLDMSKIESGKMTLNMEQISLKEVLDGITTIVQPQLKIKNQNFNVIVKNVEQESVYCDSVRLNQVLLNLLSNAIKFTGDEGTIELHLNQEASPLGDNYIRTHIRVKDNGIGMSPEFQTKIFESFTREDNQRVHRTEGTGLGMTITKYIVDQMNGKIELQSELGKGTEFHITLDLERALIPEEEMLLPPWKMLLVDDDEQLCETTVASLKEIGISGEWVLDGESAVEKAVDAHISHNRYDIILLDWKLPGIDGLETAKRIRERLKDENTPILLISAYDWGDIEDKAKEAGICGFISKPLFKSTLFYGLKKFAGDSQSAVSSASQKTDLTGTRVLLAEDNDLNWEIAETLLDSVGIICDRAENGQICADMLNKSEPGTYKAILMDIRMPVMTGYEATKVIRNLDHPDKDLPIIAMTADAFVDDMKKCLECGMNAHIAKPIDVDVVQQTLAKFIKK